MSKKSRRSDDMMKLLILLTITMFPIPLNALSFAYDPLDYEKMHEEAESIIYGKLIDIDVLKTRYPLVKVEVLAVRKNNIDAKHIYFQSFKQIGGSLEDLEKERIILFSHEVIAQDGKLLIQPITKNTGHTLGVVFKTEFDKYLASSGDDPNLKKINKLLNEFSAEEVLKTQKLN